MTEKKGDKALGGLLTAAAVAAAVISLILGVGLGSVKISPSEIFALLGNKLFGTALPEDFRPSVEAILKTRLPRVLLAFLVGAALSAGGGAVQSVLKNPLASPFTLGVSSGAAFGAAIAIAFGITVPLAANLTLAAAGLIFAVLTVAVSLALARIADKSLESAGIVLTGMVMSLFLNALVNIVAWLSGDKYELIMRWQAGSFSGRGWDSVKILAVVLVIGMIIFLALSRELDILTFGEETARSIGVSTAKVKWILLITVAVLSGCAVSFAGVIGFIDLIAPHIARRLFSSRHKVLLPMSALIGGTFMVIADLAARTLAVPRELPVGTVTALIGAPFFAVIYFKRRAAK